MKKHLFIASCMVAFSLYLLLNHLQTVKTITYFPIDTNHEFVYATTNFIILNDNGTINWSTASESDVPLYLRQDVSILYKNGKLFGILNKWHQNIDYLEQSKRFTIDNDTLLQAITFHHGEIHEKGNIKSIQQLSEAILYRFDNETITRPKNKQERIAITNINEKMDKALKITWEKWISHYNIHVDEYHLYPMVDIKQLQEYLIEQFIQSEGKRIIGQLWEGLYKNYILQAIEMKANDDMPLLLLAKDNSHLLVLYELNGEKNKLIQRIATN